MNFCCCFARSVIASQGSLVPNQSQLSGVVVVGLFSVQHRSRSTESWRNLLWGDQAQDNVHTYFGIDRHDRDITG